MDPIPCPHCQEFIIIEQLNCGIFRHGVLKKSGKQINPHASKIFHGSGFGDFPHETIGRGRRTVPRKG